MEQTRQKLAELQSRFAASIQTPFLFKDDEAKLQEDQYSETLLEELNFTFGQKRLNEYNRQYWFRLLNILQEEYPLLCNIMSHYEFNQLAMDYLSKEKIQQPFLRDLDQHFFRKTLYRALVGRPKLLQAAKVDRIYHQLFFLATKFVKVDEKLQALQPYFIIKLDYDFVQYRRDLRYEIESASLQQILPNYVLFYRSGNLIENLTCTGTEAQFLRILNRTASLASAMEFMARKLAPYPQEIWEKNLVPFFQRLSKANLLVLS